MKFAPDDNDSSPETGGIMKHERRIPFLLFVVCLVAAMPFAWGAGGLEDLAPKASISLSGGVKVDVVRATVTLCHIPPGHPANAQTIVVGQAAVAAHLAHGDYLGECHQACDGVPAAVPKTGQTVCWEDNYPAINQIPCAGTGQDGELQKGVSVDPRFTDNADGTVKDNLTGLIWLKDASCLGRQGWTRALSYANTLATGVCGLTDGSVAGDWRLPNIKELQSLIDYGQFNPALPVGHPFSGVPFLYIWSSSIIVNDPRFVWIVNIYGGYVYDGRKDITFVNVWPVRGGQ